MWVRQVHRWLCVAFTAGFVGNSVIIFGLNHGGQPPFWVYLFALIPLALLLLTGLYLFILPHATGGRRAGQQA
jgi:hypothetical protein